MKKLPIPKTEFERRIESASEVVHCRWTGVINLAFQSLDASQTQGNFQKYKLWKSSNKVPLSTGYWKECKCELYWQRKLVCGRSPHETVWLRHQRSGSGDLWTDCWTNLPSASLSGGGYSSTRSGTVPQASPRWQRRIWYLSCHPFWSCWRSSRWANTNGQRRATLSSTRPPGPEYTSSSR